MAPKDQPEKPLEVKVNFQANRTSGVLDSNLTVPKDGIPSDATSCISSSGDATSTAKESDFEHESFMAEQGVYYPASNYYGYYYQGYDGAFVGWDDQACYYGYDGLDVQYPVIQLDNGQYVYYTPGVQAAYNPCTPYPQGSVIGIDGQPYYAGPVIPQPVYSPGFPPSPLSHASDIMPTFQWDASSVHEGIHASDPGMGPLFPVPMPSIPISSHVHASAKSPPPSKLNAMSESKGASQIVDMLSNPVVQKQAAKSMTKVSERPSGFQAATVLPKGYLSLPKLPTLPNRGNSVFFYPHSAVNDKAGTVKTKGQGKVDEDGSLDLLNEQNRGPRTNSAKGSWVSVDQVGSPDAGGNENGKNLANVSSRVQYNHPEFPTKYDHALFFVIKSYSEDDIHKSIKYSVWASTSNGNKRLECAYKNAEERMKENGSKCPVFLFFSVNASGQFCGVAEMTGQVDFSKSMSFWQQDKWNGFFPVKWHIIKDVPNRHLHHIVLVNNESKPVTNSRDTQEINFPQGIEMLKIFKNYSSKTSILDDFEFYESREKAMQVKRVRQTGQCLELLPQKASEGEQAAHVCDMASIVTGVESMNLSTCNQDEPQPNAEARK